MPTFNVSEFEDSFVIHFGGEFTRINAYTLATTLINISDAAKAANLRINPGYDVEIVVEALGSGSFKTKVRAIQKAAKNLFSVTAAQNIIWGIVASYIAQVAFAPDINVIVNVSDKEVVIQQGETRIIVPRSIHDSLREVEKSIQFKRAITQAIRSVEDDPQVSSFGFANSMDQQRPSIEIPREKFSFVSQAALQDESETRDVIENAELEILRAILEKSRRRWEFSWNGVRIAAPVIDDKFYVDFFAHKLTVAPVDSLKVKLRLHQRKAEIGVFINDFYEVVEVIEHIPRPRQTSIISDDEK